MAFGEIRVAKRPQPVVAGAPTIEKAVLDVFHCGEEGHPYPWRFAVTYRGVRHEFSGIANKCATRRAATMRAWWRAKWLENGTYDQRYRISGLPT